MGLAQQLFGSFLGAPASGGMAGQLDNRQRSRMMFDALGAALGESGAGGLGAALARGRTYFHGQEQATLEAMEKKRLEEGAAREEQARYDYGLKRQEELDKIAKAKAEQEMAIKAQNEVDDYRAEQEAEKDKATDNADDEEDEEAKEAGPSMEVMDDTTRALFAGMDLDMFN